MILKNECSRLLLFCKAIQFLELYVLLVRYYFYELLYNLNSFVNII